MSSGFAVTPSKADCWRINQTRTLKDYYHILGVSESASDEQIKSAYKKLAKQYHPDKNPGNKQSEERFKEISEAYNVLSDPKARKQYDSMRRFGHHETSEGFDFSDFFKGFGFNRQYAGGQGGSFTDLFEELFTRASGGSNVYEVTIPFEKSIHGGDIELTLDHRRVRVRIPAGIEDGAELHMTGDGGAGWRLRIHVQPDGFFTRKGNDIHCDIAVNYIQLALGSTVRIRTIYNGRIDVRIPAGTQPGTRLRIPGAGVKSSRGHGDMYVRVTLEVPKSLTKKQKEALEAFGKAMELKW